MERHRLNPKVATKPVSSFEGQRGQSFNEVGSRARGGLIETLGACNLSCFEYKHGIRDRVC